MMIEQHYDEEVLIGLLDEQKPDAHLAACQTCKTALHSIRQVTSALHEETVWDRRELSEEPKLETRNNLRMFASNVAAEDAAAARWVKALLAKSSTEWRAIVDVHPEWRTAGFVRGLVAAALAVNYSHPSDALDLTKISVEVVQELDKSKYGRTTLVTLFAAAFREYAYALEYVGRHNEALTAIDMSDEVLKGAIVADYQRGQSLLVRATIFASIEKLSEALDLVRESRDIFQKFGDSRRAMIAEINEAAMLTRMRRFEQALAMYSSIARTPAADEITRASAVHNAALCNRELRRTTEAKSLFAEAVAAYERLGLVTFRARARWNFASILVVEGNFENALPIFAASRREFEELSMSHELALVAVDEAEALLLAGKTSGVPELCQSAMLYFEHAGLTYSQGALTALAYLREAAEAEVLTVRNVGDVRAFFELLPKQPTLLFARRA